MIACSKCGQVVFLAQRADGSRILVTHLGTVNCPAGGGDQLLPGLLGSR